MKTTELNGARAVRSALEALVLTSGAVATAFGIAAAAHIAFGAVRYALTVAGV